MARTKTVTVVFTDLVGSTELANQLGLLSAASQWRQASVPAFPVRPPPAAGSLRTQRHPRRWRPLVLILDDLQWAGTPELLLLKHILHTAMPLRLLIIGTYRDSDLTRTHPLTAVLADLRREAGVERIALRGLDETAVVALVSAAAGHRLTEPGIALAQALQRETEGSPFFIGEILRNLTESGAVFQEGDRWTYKGDIAARAIPEGIMARSRRISTCASPIRSPSRRAIATASRESASRRSRSGV